MGLLGKLFGKKEPELEAGPTSTASSSDEQYWTSFQHMNQYISQLDIPGALKSCNDALAASPGDIPALQTKVELLVANNQLDEALRLLDTDFRDESNALFRFTCLSWVSLQRHRFEEAIEHAGTALEIDPRSVAALNNRGFARYCLGYVDEAIKDLEKALGIDPSFDLARANLVTTHMLALNRDKALYEAERLSRKGQNRADGFLKLAYVHASWHEPARALEHVRTALGVASRHKQALLEQVYFCSALGLTRERGAALVELKEADADLDAIDLAEAFVAYHSGNNTRAETLFRAYIEKHDPETNCLKALADIAAGRGRMEEALALSDQYLKHSNQEWACIHLHTSLLSQAGRGEEACTLVDRFVERGPNNLVFLRARAIAALCVDDIAKARELLQRIKSTDIARSEIYMLAYIVEFNAERFDEALTALSWSPDKNSGEQTLYRAAVHCRLQDWETAKSRLERAFDVGTSSVLGESGRGMADQWQWLAGCHAYRAIMPGEDKPAELAEALKYYKLSIKAGDWHTRYAWYQPRLWPLREMPEFQELCKR